MSLVEELRQRESYLSSKEVMSVLEVSRAILCGWVRDGRIEAVRIGNAYRFDPRVLADWIVERTTTKVSTRRKA